MPAVSVLKLFLLSEKFSEESMAHFFKSLPLVLYCKHCFHNYFPVGSCAVHSAHAAAVCAANIRQQPFGETEKGLDIAR